MGAIIPCQTYSATEQDTVKLLLEALDADDSVTIKQTLSQWPSQPDAEHNSGDYDAPLWPFKLVLSGAIEKDNADLVSFVLDLGLNIEMYAVEVALKHPSIRIFAAFLDHGWDINEARWETIPSVLSFILNDEPLVRWFLCHGASPNATAPRIARTPLTEAGAYAPLSVVKLLIANSVNHYDILQTAAESKHEGRLAVMEFLLDERVDINAIKWSHNSQSYQDFILFGLGTALHYAAKGGFVDRVQMLLERGARIDILDSTGQTALDLARAYKKEGTARLLANFNHPGEINKL